ncbi:hypothetical protein pb186bvf_000027 [Paramecium bursaria]
METKFLKASKKFKIKEEIQIQLDIFRNISNLFQLHKIKFYEQNIALPIIPQQFKKKNFLNKLRNFYFNHFDWTEICWREKKFTKFARNQVFQIFMKHLFKRLSHIYSGLFNLFSFDEMGQKMLRINTYQQNMLIPSRLPHQSSRVQYKQ